ncbi:hypothetical protein PF005_g19594 [Phytophthora fragariae]|uniref:Uncharacterized protein n=2 Tax=Phytophthora TaxID=4783 RepID=A0A6A3XLL6_9STRA|nr:hypothetical protein PF003_g21797 [Phytophthora fragariae]KAE9002288.1 hypothetical protein PR002_g17671 [Phytophthora rubi]KAE8929456.1 hypothetical protein PF009_g20426 [Phytophthora fragariae]KAE8989226.1 hypothetical protein PF011_g18855 [Phytophthora fragariae]KAE9005710.1 hypothetical protein PR001_g17378 [Phytophthora rubi]
MSASMCLVVCSQSRPALLEPAIVTCELHPCCIAACAKLPAISFSHLLCRCHP